MKSFGGASKRFRLLIALCLLVIAAIGIFYIYKNNIGNADTPPALNSSQYSSVEARDYIIQAGQFVSDENSDGVSELEHTVTFPRRFSQGLPQAIVVSRDYTSNDDGDIGHVKNITDTQFVYSEKDLNGDKAFGKGKLMYVAIWAKNGIITKNGIPIVQAGTYTMKDGTISEQRKQTINLPEVFPGSINVDDLSVVVSKGFANTNGEEMGGVTEVYNNKFVYQYFGNGHANEPLYWIAVAGKDNQIESLRNPGFPFLYGAKIVQTASNPLSVTYPTRFKQPPLAVVSSRNYGGRIDFHRLFDATATTFKLGGGGIGINRNYCNEGICQSEPAIRWLAVESEYQGLDPDTPEFNLCKTIINKKSSYKPGDEIEYRVDLKAKGESC